METKSFIKNIFYKRREKYYSVLKRRLKNTNPTIIANDCFGTFVYHNLGLRFNSPTINLYFSKEDFIIFVQNLRGFLEAQLIEVHDETKKFPVGELEYNGKKIQINFMHYPTFEYAKMKWDDRKKRVDFSNIYIIQMISSKITKKDILDFENLPYKNKILIANENLTNSPNIIVHNILNKKNYKPGEILSYRTIFSKKRYMDKIDYVSFLNRN